jgi:predicted RNase H-like nuclease (RuvC/YqgF family)
MFYRVLHIKSLNKIVYFSCRVIRELEAQLEYERIRREELEADSDKLRSKIHSLTMELEEMRNMSLSKVTTKRFSFCT